ncbi:signal peptidase complex subunit 2 [Natrinema gelatinilyticum]|uniref:signal peptidase complex subunit 2 n=1 Tax=Natrinema gelatinilyticum TaxID=2961571 RepID=UPI0020C20109|nr:signal peptidase complex subunit 2 [Natrinema gelatinilyticum]
MSSRTERRERDPDHVREIGHEEYDPIGTAILIGIYFLILVLLWVFMYFVEFLGNGPTVVGAALTVVGLA